MHRCCCGRCSTSPARGQSTRSTRRLGKPAVTLDDIKHFRQLGQQGAGPPRIPLGLGRRGHHRPARTGCRQQRRHGDRPEVACHALQPAAVPRSSITTSMRFAATAASWKASARRRRRLPVILASISCAGSTTTTTSPSRAAREITFTEDVAARFLGYGWNVLRVGDANDIGLIEHALSVFRKTKGRPTLIILDSSHRLRIAASSRTPPRRTGSRSARRRYA